MIGIFPPTTLMAPPCEPKGFDFYTCTLADLLDFTVPIDFVASRTAIMHGLASWFDLDFEASEQDKARNGGVDETPADAEAEAAWDYPVAAQVWPWMTAEPPLNPNPTPEPPRRGVKVTLSTGPSGELASAVSGRASGRGEGG